MKEAVKIIFGEFFGTLIFISVALGKFNRGSFPPTSPDGGRPSIK